MKKKKIRPISMSTKGYTSHKENESSSGFEDFLKFLGIVSLVIAVGYGCYKLFSPSDYSEGKCFVNSDNRFITARIESSGVGFEYQFVDIENLRIERNWRGNSFKGLYKQKLDCSQFFEERSSVMIKKAKKESEDTIEHLREEIQELKKSKKK